MAASNDSLLEVIRRRHNALVETQTALVEDSSAAVGNESTAPLTESELERFSLARAGIQIVKLEGS